MGLTWAPLDKWISATEVARYARNVPYPCTCGTSKNYFTVFSPLWVKKKKQTMVERSLDTANNLPEADSFDFAYLWRFILGVCIRPWQQRKCCRAIRKEKITGEKQRKSRSNGSLWLPEVLLSRLFNKKEGEEVTFLSPVSLTTNRSPRVLKLQFSPAIFSMNRNSHRADAVTGRRIKDRQAGWMSESRDLPPITCCGWEEKNRAKKNTRSTKRMLPVDALIPPVWYRFIVQTLVPEWLPYWAHLHRNVYLHFSNWVPTLKSVHQVTDTDTVLCHVSQLSTTTRHQPCVTQHWCQQALLLGLGVEERS